MKLSALQIFTVLLLALIFSSSLGYFMNSTEGFKGTSKGKDEGNFLFDKSAHGAEDKHGNKEIGEFELAAPPANHRHHEPSSHRSPGHHGHRGHRGHHGHESSYIGPAGDTVILGGRHHNNYNPAHNPHHKKKHKKHHEDDSDDDDDDGPLGIPGSQIPIGSEDMYILKSEVIPPVCPACPSFSGCPSKTPYPPCPPCARCAEPSFECKKVPNYKNDNNYLPMPVLADFSQFGM